MLQLLLTRDENFRLTNKLCSEVSHGCTLLKMDCISMYPCATLRVRESVVGTLLRSSLARSPQVRTDLKAFVHVTSLTCVEDIRVR